ncbi:VOC family protein [Oceaniglobus trochenteri]|uniref:VOC family protein n=1 Tax=Oceaniglobus trochenteri TaxID=2763260 RepID=UPI001D00040C|nr:VOC family protein [Oceaniglobus trochenteri]
MPAPFFELGSDDLAATRDFFVAALGWDWQGELGQGWFESGEGQIGLHKEEVPAMAVFLPVRDLDATLDKVRISGGVQHGGIVEEPGFGRFAQCSDPRGLRFGLMEPAAKG